MSEDPKPTRETGMLAAIRAVLDTWHKPGRERYMPLLFIQAETDEALGFDTGKSPLIIDRVLPTLEDKALAVIFTRLAAFYTDRATVLEAQPKEDRPL